MSTVNLAEVLIHTAKYAHASGVDPTAQELGARLHTTDCELARQLRRVRLAITHY